MGTPKLVHFTFMRNEGHCLEGMLDCIMPYVDESYILVDDRSTDNSEDIAKSYGVNTRRCKFQNFAKFKNTLFKWIQEETGGNCWMLGMAPDERVYDDFMPNVRELLDKIDLSVIDGVRIARKHWLDLERTELAPQDAHWYPDWQTRLLRVDYPRIHSTRYVHEVIQGLRQQTHFTGGDVHHFNLVFKDRARWDEMNQQYAALQALQQQDGGWDIWPDEG